MGVECDVFVDFLAPLGKGVHVAELEVQVIAGQKGPVVHIFFNVSVGKFDLVAIIEPIHFHTFAKMGECCHFAAVSIATTYYFHYIYIACLSVECMQISASFRYLSVKVAS